MELGVRLMPFAKVCCIGISERNLMLKGNVTSFYLFTVLSGQFD